MKYFVTGGAGFIGSNLIDVLLEKGNVTVYDNLSLGKEEFISHYFGNKKFRFVKADLLDRVRLSKEIKGHDIVFHLAANSDIAQGTKYTDIDLRQGTIATYNVLESMRVNAIKKIVFSSSSAVYGEAIASPIPEDYGPLLPISLYGASKLASEGLISAFCHNYNMQAWILRFANIVGRHGTHGVIYDFINKLKNNPRELEILGDGHQAKPYLEVQDCISGMLFALENAKEELNYFNLGCKGNTTVNEITKILIEESRLEKVKLIYTGGKRGWKGDVSIVKLDVNKMKELGWKSRYNSSDAIRIALKALIRELS